jgi:alpha-beta hydrolase superfamily lysophospholipase
VDDLIEFRQQFVSDPPRPCILLAVSWGAKVATSAAARWPWLFAGLILIGPGFFPKVRPSLADRCLIALSSLLSPRRQFPIPLNDPELFTASFDWQQFIRDDPLALHTATARLLVASVLLDRHLRRLAPSLRVPTLLLTAEHDRIIRNQPTRQWLASWASRDLTLREIPGGHHTLEFEPDINVWFPLLHNWLAERFGLPRPTASTEPGVGSFPIIGQNNG